MMNLHLIDIEYAVVESWKKHFHDSPEVRIAQGNILSLAHTAIVSPANSYGYMDGGIDLAYVEFFGTDLQVKVQNSIRQRVEGHLPVGASLLVETGHARIGYLIVSPTMFLPQPVLAQNCFFSMAATLRLVDRHPELSDVFCPGLGTGTGRVSPDDSASEMAKAYRKWKSSKT